MKDEIDEALVSTQLAFVDGEQEEDCTNDNDPGTEPCFGPLRCFTGESVRHVMNTQPVSRAIRDLALLEWRLQR